MSDESVNVGAPVVRDLRSDAYAELYFKNNNERSYVAVAIVDGQNVELQLRQNSAGVIGDNVANIIVDGVQYNAQMRPSDDSVAVGTPRLDVGRDKPADRMAPEVIGAIEQAMFGADSPGRVTDEEFRQIRDVFQRIDHGELDVSNSNLNQQAPSNERGGRGDR